MQGYWYLDQWLLLSDAVFNERMCLVGVVAVEKFYNINNYKQTQFSNGQLSFLA